ncbi:MAG: VTT domain-containing protein [Patescibacteria group bacterium]
MTIILASLVNGRATALVVGAFIGQGYLNPFAAYWIFVAMDFMGDTLYYCLGRIGQLGGKFLIRESWQEKISQFNGGLKKNLPKALLFGKITMVGSKPIIVAAGMTKMPLFKFWSVNMPCTLVLFFLYMAAGYLFSQWIL